MRTSPNERAVTPPPRPADQGADAGQQLLEGERLAEIIVRARVEPSDAVAHSVAGGQEQHGRITPGRSIAAEDRQAIRLGQRPVEQDKVPGGDLQRVLGRLAVGGVLDGETFLAEPSDEEVRDL